MIRMFVHWKREREGERGKEKCRIHCTIFARMLKSLTYDLIPRWILERECFANETSVRCAKKRVLRMQQCLDNKERR